jgi:AraC-like DNA-binding protein
MSVTEISAEPPPDAIILLANYASFSPGAEVRHGRVQSRMLLWCKSGKGTVSVNGSPYVFTSGCFLFIPWNHHIHYRADNDDPFLVAGIHIIPKLPRGRETVWHVFHAETPESDEYQRREDADAPGFEEIYFGRFNESSPLAMLAEYIVAWFDTQPREEFMARSLARALLYELWNTQKHAGADFGKYPPPLRRALDFIAANPEREIPPGMLTKAAECSAPTIFRMFKKHLGRTPGDWILRQKIAHASELLKKTALPVKTVAARSGINDPHYFCKAFRRVTGSTASEYRSRHSLVKGANIRIGRS